MYFRFQNRQFHMQFAQTSSLNVPHCLLSHILRANEKGFSIHFPSPLFSTVRFEATEENQ